MKRGRWYDWSWIWPLLYFPLGAFNILFGLLGTIEFMLPLAMALFGGDKWSCEHMCGRGQLFTLLAKNLHVSRRAPAPRWLSSRAFRWAFLAFFMTMFANVLYQTWLVFGGTRSLRQTVTLLWTFRVPWHWAYTVGPAPDWIAHSSFGLYGLMLTSELIGLIVMALWRPRTWCTFCPMGTMTQLICEAKHRGAEKG
ncbi:MAG: 4Fe-4S binding protein [Synergistaceae bacterium]|nr:4Fe-4S binding protein [Synergistaceae bacterium]